jgi:hypothetical protein
MTIDSGEYCEYCTDDSGDLRSFDETFERFVQFAMGRDADLDRATAETKTRGFMSSMPAWQGHPKLVS